MIDGREGLEIVNAIAEADVVLRDDFPEGPEGAGSLPSVVLTDEPPSLGLFRYGVSGIVPRIASASQIVAALYAAAAGLIALPVEVIQSVIPASPAPAPEIENLTPREIETLEMLAEGLSNKQIAAALQISEHTAKFHVNSILGKLGAGTRTEAVMRGLRAGLIKV